MYQRKFQPLKEKFSYNCTWPCTCHSLDPCPSLSIPEPGSLSTPTSQSPCLLLWLVHQLFCQHHPQDHQLVCGSNCGAPPRCTCAPPPSLVSRRLPCGHARKWNPGAPCPAATFRDPTWLHTLPPSPSTSPTLFWWSRPNLTWSLWSWAHRNARARANVMTLDWVSSASHPSAGGWRRPHWHYLWPQNLPKYTESSFK